LVVTGCGGDDSSISKQEYDQQLELICNQGLKGREELFQDITEEFEEKGGKGNTPDVQAKNIRKLMVIYQETTAEIADIGLPEEGEKQAEELVRAREDAAAKVEADPLSAREDVATIFAKPTKLAEDLEAKSCGA
jgi:hypothetical protein